MNNFRQLQEAISVKFTSDLLQEVLKKRSKCENVEITQIEMGKATRKGDSYLSHVTRFSVHYNGCLTNHDDDVEKKFTLHIIGKALIRNIAKRKTMRCAEFFRNEINFYEKVWPAMDAFQKQMNVADIFTEIPNYLCGYIDGENDFILLEDLSFQGYEELDRCKQLRFEMLQIILQIFARFHGLGYAFKQVQLDNFEKAALQLKETYFHENYRTWYGNFLQLLKNVSMDAVQKQLPVEYCTKLREIYKIDIFGEAAKSCMRRSKFSTITHGDAWIPNMLMRFSSESIKPEHSVMIDFQLTRYGSIALDLHMLFYVCGGIEIWTHYDELLTYYCSEFNKFVAQFDKTQRPALTYEELANELKAAAYFGLCMSMEATIWSLVEDEDVNDDELEGDEAVPIETVWTLKPFRSEVKRIKIAQMVQHMIDRNYI